MTIAYPSAPSPPGVGAVYGTKHALLVALLGNALCLCHCFSRPPEKPIDFVLPNFQGGDSLQLRPAKFADAAASGVA
ncbi:hypothetical protein JIQ42_05539 [Leishmania sp. Namibia]|uniref:hypothetical protein n=1 Tax=Leishmania sp. Namibia TaxID=2802991 RepID=UPI001B597C76|nr:hypothetical protein JIQ42_05539 [Leishmania sp. Namibia]